MRGLVQDVPLTIDAIFRHVERHFGDGTIITNTAEGIRRTTYAEWAQRTRRLGGVLGALGITGDGRWAPSVGTANGIWSCTSPRSTPAGCCTR